MTRGASISGRDFSLRTCFVPRMNDTRTERDSMGEMQVPAEIGAADSPTHQSAKGGGRRHRAHLGRTNGRGIGRSRGRPRGIRQGYSPGGRGRIAPPGSLGPLDARTAPVRRGMAAGQLPVTDADALKPAEYGLNVDDSQSACAAQQFVAPHEHHQDKTANGRAVDRRSSCLFRIGSSHLDLIAADSNAEKAILQRGIVIGIEVTRQTSSSSVLTWNPAPATALANG